jgi:hypothetical protein
MGDDGELIEEFDLLTKDLDDLDDLRRLVERAVEVLQHHPELVADVSEELYERDLAATATGRRSAASCTSLSP